MSGDVSRETELVPLAALADGRVPQALTPREAELLQQAGRGQQVEVPVTEQELVGLRLRRPADAPRLRVRTLSGGMVLRAGALDRWAIEQMVAWRTEDGAER